MFDSIKEFLHTNRRVTISVCGLSTISFVLGHRLRGRPLLVPTKNSGEPRRSNAKVFTSLVILATASYALRRFNSSQGGTVQAFKTRILKFLGQSLAKRPETVRSAFTDLEWSAFEPVRNHTHPAAAADRSTATTFISRFAAVLGSTAYFIQRSRADERAGRVGSRDYYWMKDITTQPAPMKIPANPLVALVDVDQYMDIPTFLSDHVHPTILYTFQPTAVARIDSNYSFTFNDKDEVMYNVAGGAYYQHKVWNYSTDCILVAKTLFGIPYRAATYIVDRRMTSPDHELVFLNPIGSWGVVGSVLATSWLSSATLKHLKVATREGFLRLQLNSQEGVKMSTGRPGSYAAATVPIVVDDTISTVARTSKYDLTMPQVTSFVEGDKITGAVLLDYHRVVPKSVKPDVVCPIPDSVRRYQFNPANFEADAKASMVAFMTPMVHGAFVPDQSQNNELACIEERVVNVRPKTLPLTPFLIKVMEEFLVRMVPEDVKHTLDPVDDDEVLDRQNRPTQRRVLAMSEVVSPDRKVSMFMKKEAYQDVKPPRPISQINGVDKREYSKIMYSFTLYAKRFPWHAFGQTPRAIASRVVSVCERAVMVTNTDFSKFDGHGSNVMRELEKMLLLRLFRVQYHETILDLHRSQYGLRAYGTFGMRYETHYSRASGSPETSIFNTLINAFVAFVALRKTMVGGIYKDADEAFQGLGIYGGDDGLTGDVDPSSYRRAASSIGQELTVQPVSRGELGVKFLARVYSPDVWFGEHNSCCDVLRQVSKLHVTVRLPSNVTPIEKLLEKVRCLALSDVNTPIVGEFCQAILKIHGGEIKASDKTAVVSTWLSHFEKSTQYLNEPSEWMVAYVEKEMPLFDYKKFKTWVSQADTYDKLLAPPMFMEKPPANPGKPVVVDGQVVAPVTQPPVPATPVVKVWKSKTGETFEQLKQRKIAAGTWKPDKPKVRAGNGPNQLNWRAPRARGVPGQ